LARKACSTVFTSFTTKSTAAVWKINRT
jgi:hypothetical protein